MGGRPTSSRLNSDLPRDVDLLVLGSGAAGLTAALTGALEGASVCLLEHEPALGGTSARSSGTLWVPDNPYMRASGHEKDRGAAEKYLDVLVDGRGCRDMWQRFLDAGPRMLADLGSRAGIGFRPFPAAPDYRQDLPGAAAGWRALEPLSFDGRRLDSDFAAIAPPLPELMLFGGMMVTRAEAASLLRADRSLSGALLGARLMARFLLDRLHYGRGTRLVMGNALVARLVAACLERGVVLRTGTSVRELIRNDGRVAGAELDGEVIRSRAVVLSGGGFPASATWREKELPAPVAQHTPAAPGAVGRTIELGLAAGGSLGPSGLDNALWFPSSTMTRTDGTTAVWPHIVLDRAKPGCLIVDATGRRFANEAVSYHDFVRAMYRANGNGEAIPAFLICDRMFIRRYGLGLIRPRTPSLRRYVRNGYLAEAANAAGLARKLGLPQEGLLETIRRFNGFAASGKDADFKRGETIYDRAGGDPAHAPNPCLGPIGEGPLYAVKLWPTPLGTSRGLVADADARVLDTGGAPVPGLYVAGNDMQSVFGGEYPGAGAQLGQGMTFGWIAARHAVGTT